MWFKFPSGVRAISVEQQNFRPIFKNPDGEEFFQAPDHFAPRILRLKGFKSVARPEGAPEHIHEIDPLRDGAIADLGKMNETLKAENTELRSGLIGIQAEFNAMKYDLQQKTNELVKLKHENAELRERLEEFEDLQQTNAALGAKNSDDDDDDSDEDSDDEDKE